MEQASPERVGRVARERKSSDDCISVQNRMRFGRWTETLGTLQQISLSLLSLQANADVPTDRGAYGSFPLPIISLCAKLMENEAIGKNLAFSDQCLKTCRNSTKILGNFGTFFSI